MEGMGRQDGWVGDVWVNRWRISGYKSLWPPSPLFPCISHAEWNFTLESYVVHTNYDEYAITLTKKLSHHRGPTITAKLYGKGLELDKLTGAGGRRRLMI